MTTINHYGKYIDSNIPVTGVLSIHDINWDCYPFDDEICLICDEWIKEHDQEHDSDCECIDYLECDSSHSKLIGGWILDTKTGKYDIDKDSEYSAIVNESTIQVVHSKYIASGAPCSPCYVGQIDLDSSGDFKAYTLPKDMLYTESGL